MSLLLNFIIFLNKLIQKKIAERANFILNSQLQKKNAFKRTDANFDGDWIFNFKFKKYCEYDCFVRIWFPQRQKGAM